MPILLAGICLLPFGLSFAVMYLVCHKTRRWYLRAIAPVAVVVAGALIAWGRYRVWSSQAVAPWTQILLFPGVSILFALTGLLMAWRLWERRRRPRVVKDN